MPERIVAEQYYESITTDFLHYITFIFSFMDVFITVITIVMLLLLS